MAFPVDLLENYSHEDLESSGEDYMSDLRCGDPENPEFLSLASNVKIPIRLSTIGFVPLYGGEERHKVLALFAPEDSLTAVALFLADQWWPVDDIVRTSDPSREGLLQVNSIGERVVLYVLNRLIYRKQEMEKNECPFLCHGSHDYAKILWKKGEAIGFYSVKLPACQKYFERYPGDHDLLWEIEGTGNFHQRKTVASILQRESFKCIGMMAWCKHGWGKGGDEVLKNTRLLMWTLEKGFFKLAFAYSFSEFFQEQKAHRKKTLSTRSRGNNLKRPKLGKRFQEPEMVEDEDISVFQTPESRYTYEMEVEPLNGELVEDAIKVSIVAEGQTGSEAVDGESKLQLENPEETTLTLLVPLILDSSVKSTEDSDDNVSDKEQQATQRKRTLVPNADPVAAAEKEEPSNNGLSNSVAATEALEDTISENVSPNTTSSVEEQSEEGGSDTPEAPVVLGQGALVMVELEDISYSHHPEGQKNQLDEQSEESAEPASEKAADSSSEDVEIEVPVVDRRTLRRKAKGYKGPPKKKGKLI
uniref:Family with sequence similarity 169 member A n=1 Tax=Podarcis muralis TaxID=64176 RepID=A0A670JUD2_PODMU